MNSLATRRRATSAILLKLVFRVCGIGFPLVGIAIVIAVSVPLMVSDVVSKPLTAKLTFASLGMLFGIFQVFLGVLLGLIGVTIGYDIDAGVGPAKVKLVSTSPGLLLLVLGNVLIGVSLTREFEVTKTEISGGSPRQGLSGDLPMKLEEDRDPLNGVGGPK